MPYNSVKALNLFGGRARPSAMTDTIKDLGVDYDLFFAFEEEHCSPTNPIIKKASHNFSESPKEQQSLRAPVSNPVARFQLMPRALDRAEPSASESK